jgi:hypothetical protein
MSWARALAFNLALFAWTAILGTIGLPFLFTPRAVTMRFGRFWAWSVLVLLGSSSGSVMRSAGSTVSPPVVASSR